MGSGRLSHVDTPLRRFQKNKRPWRYRQGRSHHERSPFGEPFREHRPLYMEGALWPATSRPRQPHPPTMRPAAKLFDIKINRQQATAPPSRAGFPACSRPRWSLPVGHSAASTFGLDSDFRFRPSGFRPVGHWCLSIGHFPASTFELHSDFRFRPSDFRPLVILLAPQNPPKSPIPQPIFNSGPKRPRISRRVNDLQRSRPSGSHRQDPALTPAPLTTSHSPATSPPNGMPPVAGPPEGGTLYVASVVWFELAPFRG
jgi:hypothetical protein